MPIVPAPNAGTYSTRTQYVSAKEFLAAPTGVSTSDLVPGGTVAQNQQSLTMLLERASAWADNYCQQTIAASVNTQSGQYRVVWDSALGAVIKVPLANTPVVAVSDVRIGTTPGGLSELGDYSNIWISRKVATIPVVSMAHRLFAQVQYVNGWANTAFTAAATAGDMVLTVGSALGVMPGQSLNVQSGSMSESVTVSPSWSPSNTAINVAIPITTPLVNAYMVGDTVTAFPQDIKQAVILITKSLILTKGSQALIIPQYGAQPSQTQHVQPAVTNDMDIATGILNSYKRVH